jgi:protein-disulfide isomerase
MIAGEDDEQDLTLTRRQERASAQRKSVEVDGEMRGSWLKHVGIVAGAIIAISVVIPFGNGCGTNQATPKPSGTQARATGGEATQAQRTEVQVASLLAGIPQRGNTLGDPRAPVTLQYFADLECPYCRRFTLGLLPSLIQSYVRGGRLKIEYRSLETATRNPATFKLQQVAALAAGRQNKMWDFIDLFYHEQGQEGSGYVTERYLQGLARRVTGLNLIGWTVARNDPALAVAITSDARAASNAGLGSTPSFLLATAGHTPYVSAIERVLRG